MYNVGKGDRDRKPEEEEDSKSSKLGDRGSGRGICKEGGVRVPASSGSGTRFLQRVVQDPLLGDWAHHWSLADQAYPALRGVSDTISKDEKGCFHRC